MWNIPNAVAKETMVNLSNTFDSTYLLNHVRRRPFTLGKLKEVTESQLN